jgi:hypothetical protein
MILHIVHVLPRQIRANDLPAGIRRSHVDLNALPPALPIRIGKETVQNFRVKVALALKVRVDALRVS